MPVRAVCPECGATTSLDDSAPAATFTCHQCGETVPVPAIKPAGPPPLPRSGPPPLPAPASAPANDDGYEMLVDELDSAVAVAIAPPPPRSRRRDADDDEEPRPSKARPPAPTKAAGGAYEVIEDDEDDAPSAARRKARDDDEDDDRPVSRRKGPTKAKSPMLVIVGGLAAVLLVAGGSVGAYLLWPEPARPTILATNNPNGETARPAPVAALPTTLALPGKITDICAGSSGQKLLVHCAAERKLVVVDLLQRRIRKEIPTAGPDTLIAAGKTKFLVVDAKATVVQRWDFESLTMDDQANVPWEGRAKAVSLGCLSDGPALVLMDGPADVWPVFFLNVQTFKPADVVWVSGTPAASTLRDLKLRAAANGSAWAGVAAAPDGFVGGVHVRLEGKRARYTPERGKGMEFLTPSPDGESTSTYAPADPPSFNPVVLTTGSRPVSPDDRWLSATANTLAMMFKAGPSPSEFILRGGGHPEALVHVRPFPRPAGPDSGLTADQVVFVPNQLSVAAVVPPSADRLEFVDLPFWADARKVAQSFSAIVSVPPRTFTPTQPFRYPVQAASTKKTSKFVLHKGPPGAKIGPEGMLEWNPPRSAPDREEFAIGVTPGDDGGPIERAFQSFTVYNTDTPVPVIPKPKTNPKKKTPDPKKSPDPKPMDPVVVNPGDGVAPGAKLLNPLPARVAITPTDIPDGRLDVPLGGALRDVCVGGGGRYLIAHVPTGRRLVVFDVSAGKIVKTINLGADAVLFAAGMSKLLVVYPDEKQILRFSLPDGKLELDAELDLRPKPVAAAMGSATAGPLVLGGPVTQNNASKLGLTFLDVETLKEVRIDKADGDLKVGFASAANLRISADGRTLATWYKQLQPSGLQLVRLAGNTLTGVHKAEGVGHVTPGPYGQLIYTEKGMYNLKGEPVEVRQPSVPAVHGPNLLSLIDAPGGAKSVAVWMGEDDPRGVYTTLPGFDGKKDPFERDIPTLALDKRLFLVPDAKALVVVPPAADRFLVYPNVPLKK